MTKSLTIAGAALAFGLSVSAAQAATQLIHFDDASNGWKSYTTTDGNFTLDPTNLQSGNCADSTTSGNGSCVIEQRNGELTTLTRNLDTQVGSTSNERFVPNTPDYETVDRNPNDDPFFKLDSFYLEFTGKGADPNFFMIEGFNGTTSLGSATYQLGNSYGNASLYSDGSAAGVLTFDTPYIFDMTTVSPFQANNLTKVVWTASASAQLRLDCVVTSFSGTTSEPLSGFSDGCGTSGNGGGGGPGEIPLPAGLPLLLSALGLGAFLHRRARKSA